jgi:RHS repeat-associated protein
LVDNQTGNPALLQRDSGVLYLAYRKGSSIYILSNEGSGWSSPVQTTTTAQGDPALLDTGTDILIIYKGLDGYFYRISSPDGSTWSSPIKMAPQKPLSNPSAMRRKDRLYRVVSQSLSSSTADLAKVTEFSYEGDSSTTWSSDVLIRDAQTLQSSMHFEYDSKGRTIERISKDAQGVQTQKIVYTYNGSDRVIREDVYAGTSTEISFSTITGYDNHGNVTYTRNPEDAESFYSYANTNSQNQFVDSKGVPVTLFTNQFYTNSIPSDCHTLPVGSAFINNGKVEETYHKYDIQGNLIETKTLFPTRDYAIFSGVFDETDQTSFAFDLTGLTITDGILVISSSAVPYTEPLYETHSEPGIGYQNSGVWQGKYFLADYLRCTPEPDCYTGQTKIGPFEHYPGSPDYTGYTLWVEDNFQYVKTHFSQSVNEYPAQVDYKINTTSWETITNNLGSGTTSTIIPASCLVMGSNTLQFEESNSYSTKFEWVLYLNQGATPEEFTTSFTYDTHGNINSITDALGSTTLLTYDTSHTYLASITNALNHTIAATYNFNTGLLTSITDAKGNTSFFEYDILGRITRKINPDLTEKEAVYNDTNNCVRIYDELDHYTIQYYDGIGRLTKTEAYLSALVLTEEYTYNYQNNVKTHTDSGGHTSSYEYDSRGRTTKIANPDSTFKEMSYDDASNTVSVFDENQHKKEYGYDWIGNLLWIKEYSGSANYVTTYTYDLQGNVTSITDANGNTTLYSYESLFGATQITHPDLTTETFAYDAVGNLVQKTESDITTTFIYDQIYQLMEVLYPDFSVSFDYDVNGNRTLMTDPAGTTSYTYDERNRCTSETRTINGVPYIITYAYDAGSRVIAASYPDQSAITYEYDSLNRLTAIPGYAQFTFDTDSLISSTTYSNGTVTNYDYDNCHRPVSISTLKNDSDLLSLNYQYDPVGNITQMEYNQLLPDFQQMESTEIFGYDWLDRLISAEGDYGSLSYSYDGVGNRLSQNDQMYTYNNMNELVSINSTTFSCDDNGNTLTKTDGTDTWSYTYDKRNLLAEVVKNQQVIAQYTYDGDGRRIQKREWIEDLQNYQTIVYCYSGLNIIYEKNITTNQEATSVYGPTGRIAKKVSGLTDYYHTDHLGSTRLITDESGNPVTAVNYTPFGESVSHGEDDTFLFTGKERDSSGLYYFGSRYYDSETGRFLTRDTKGGTMKTPQTLNKYIYCLNNPLKYIDPTGNNAETPQDAVEDVFDTLHNIDPETYAEIQAKVDNGEMTPIEALALIIEFLGYTILWTNPSDMCLCMEISDGFAVTVVIDNELKDKRGMPLWGEYDPDTETVSINFNRSGNVADVALVFLHEASHAILDDSGLSIPEQEQLIYSVEYSYMLASRFWGVEYSDLYRTHIFSQVFIRDRSGFYQPPFPGILERWLPRIKHIIA